MNAWVHLGFSYIFMHFKKLNLCIKVTFPSKPEFYQMKLGKSFQNWDINLPKDLA